MILFIFQLNAEYRLEVVVSLCRRVSLNSLKELFLHYQASDKVDNTSIFFTILFAF